MASSASVFSRTLSPSVQWLHTKKVSPNTHRLFTSSSWGACYFDHIQLEIAKVASKRPPGNFPQSF